MQDKCIDHVTAVKCGMFDLYGPAYMQILKLLCKITGIYQHLKITQCRL